MNILRGLGVAVLLVGGCASLPADFKRSESHVLRDTETTRLGQVAQPLLKAHPGESGFLPLRSGVDALLARMVLAEAAERTLDVQYYIWHEDLTGRFFADALLRAADRGVRVRVLLDDVGVRADDETLLSLDTHPNIEIRLFNPVATRSFRNLGMLTDFSRVNRRMHNKSFIADNQRAILGGRNIGDEYFEAQSEVAFGDLDVLTVGRAVSDVSDAFDLYWNAPASYPISALLGRSGDPKSLDALRTKLTAFVDAQRDSPYVTRAKSRLVEMIATGNDGFYWGKADLLYDDPSKITREPEDTAGHLVPQFADVKSQIKDELLIVSPYFVPGDKGVDWLGGLVKRGVRVIVLTNSLAATDVGAVHAGYQRYRKVLLEAGVRLYELKPGAIEQEREKRGGGISGSRASLHAKTFVFDRRAVFIGSLNLDPRSIQLNTEIGLVCESAPLAEDLAGTIEKNLDKIAWRLELAGDSSGNKRIVWVETGADDRVRQLADEPEVSTWRKFSVWFLGLLPIESQL